MKITMKINKKLTDKIVLYKNTKCSFKKWIKPVIETCKFWNIECKLNSKNKNKIRKPNFIY
jgi:hypothetical protein